MQQGAFKHVKKVVEKLSKKLFKVVKKFSSNLFDFDNFCKCLNAPSMNKVIWVLSRTILTKMLHSKDFSRQGINWRFTETRKCSPYHYSRKGVVVSKLNWIKNSSFFRVVFSILCLYILLKPPKESFIRKELMQCSKGPYLLNKLMFW